MANKWMDRLLKLDGAVNREYNPFAHVVRFPTPSLNFILGRAWGIPKGYGALIYGPPKGGKTLIVNGTIGQFHKDYPEGIAVKFDTEMREEAQLQVGQMPIWGIDPERLITYSVNSPEQVFDYIAGPLREMIQEGAPIGMIAIDSLYNIKGRRYMDQDTMMTQQRGDRAATIGDGLKWVLETVRKERLALLVTDQVRAEQDERKLKQHKTIKMASAWAAQHFFEYFIFAEKLDTAEGRKDYTGKEFVNEELTDLAGKAERTGHKIRVSMEDSSLGPKGRTAVFTLDYNKGFVNIEEEVFILGVNRGVIDTSKQAYYGIGDQKYHGAGKAIAALKENPEIQQFIIKELMKLDANWTPLTEEASP